MSNVTSALMKTNWIAALLCTASLFLPCAHAQQSEADRQTLAQLRAKAEQGDAPSQNDLGEAFALGKLNVATNWVEAVKWWRKAAEQNFAPAQVSLGSCYAAGQGVDQDYVEVYKWYLLAGAQGDELAKQYMTRLERQLTRQQLAEGQKRAGDFKLPEVPSLDAQPGEADGNPLPDLRAKAATGEAKAQNELGEALYAGKLGVAKNPLEAVKWFRQAAEQNNVEAQYNLNVCYELGNGVAKNEVEAYKWNLLAAAQGDNKAKRNASMLELMLSRGEIADGKRRAEDWLEQRKKTSSKIH